MQDVLEQARSGFLQQLDFGVLPEIDSAGMSARFRICTPRKDREGDIIEPSGVDWYDYQFAPVVKYEHGFTGIPFPVARSSDDNGILHVTYGGQTPDGEEEDAIYARAFFKDRHELSAQLFALIEDGFIRAASIHVLPFDGCSRPLPNEGCHALKSALLEWSVCTVAMNGDAYAKSLKKDSALAEVLNLQLDAANKILERGTLGGARILPSLAKCLKAVRPAKQPIALGHNFNEEAMKKSLTQAEVDKLTPIGLAKSLSEVSEFDADTVKLLRAKAKSYDETMMKTGNEPGDSLTKSEAIVDPESMIEGAMPKADEAIEPMESAESAISPGADYLTAVHSAISELIAKLDGASKATEKPEVLEFAASFADELRTALATAEGAYSSIYPDAPALASAEPPAEAEMVKSWVAEKGSRSYQLNGLAARLAKSLNDPKRLKAAAQATARDLRLLDAQAKSWKPKVSDSAVSAEEFAALKKSVSDLVAKLSQSPA